MHQIKAIKISQPAQRALQSAGIETLEQLAQYTEKDLLELHGMGPKALDVLKQSLAESGLIFKYSNEYMEGSMREIQYSIEIKASKERVWAILWDDITFRDWANIIDEGMYIQGSMEERNEIQFISSVNGYGVTSLIEKLQPNEFVLFRHGADTKESGQQLREREWTGGTESYSLTEKNGVTTLLVKTDIPQEQEETFNVRFPRALERIKTLAEKIR